MEFYTACKNVPYTISIQFDANSLLEAQRALSYYGMQNRISNHISIKYIDTENALTEDRIRKTLDRLNGIRKISMESITITKFNIMHFNEKCQESTLYLEVEPYSYLQRLHLIVIRELRELTNIYERHDLKNFIPHISCGILPDGFSINELNNELRKMPPVVIPNWSLVLHTSTREYSLL